MSYGSLTKSSLLNSYSATPLTVDTSTTPSTYRISGLLPILKGDVRSVSVQAAVVEVVQEYTVGGAVVPVVTASTKYQLKVGNTDTVQQGTHNQLQYIGYTSPAALSGTAATDRHLMYLQMASQITANPATWATGYALITITQTNTAAFAENEIVTQSVSGAVGINLKTSSGGAAGTTGTLTLGVISGTFTSASATLTGSITGTASATAATVTTGVGLRILDDANYFYPQTSRGGVNTVLLTLGWTTPSTMGVVTTAGVISYGQAAYLTRMIPVLAKDGNLASGQWEMATNNAPVTAQSYGKVTIIDEPSLPNGGVAMQNSGTLRTQVLWLNNADGDYAAAVAQLVTMNNNVA